MGRGQTPVPYAPLLSVSARKREFSSELKECKKQKHRLLPNIPGIISLSDPETGQKNPFPDRY
ncbi:MAG: hypothetical protein Kow0089_12570 [Desulfobulbaceae bacterium]